MTTCASTSVSQLETTGGGWTPLHQAATSNIGVANNHAAPAAITIQGLSFSLFIAAATSEFCVSQSTA